jgi:hypothetical protein
LKKRVLLVALLLAFALVTTKAAGQTDTTMDCVVLVEMPVDLYEVFTVNITVVDVEGVAAWQIRLDFDSTMLQCIEVREPADHIFAGKSNVIDPIIDNTGGVIDHGFVFFPVEPEDVFTGSGVLCEIDFNATSIGISNITFLGVEGYSDTFLLDFDEEPIPFDIETICEVEVVPEFPPVLITVLLLSLTLFAVLLAKKQRSKIIQPKISN